MIRYENAMKVFGEKELEIAILRELLKKKSPLSKKFEVTEPFIKRGEPAALVLRTLGLSESTYYD